MCISIERNKEMKQTIAKRKSLLRSFSSHHLASSLAFFLVSNVTRRMRRRKGGDALRVERASSVQLGGSRLDELEVPHGLAAAGEDLGRVLGAREGGLEERVHLLDRAHKALKHVPEGREAPPHRRLLAGLALRDVVM